MKRAINLLLFLLTINFLIFLNLLVIQFNSDLNFVPISYAKTSKYTNNDNYNLIVRILKDTNRNSLIQFVEYINIDIISNIPNAPENKIAFNLSLPQQVSFIAFYDKVSDDELKYSFTIDNLSNIDNFYYYKDFIVVEQHDSNTNTDFTERNYIEIFNNKDGCYQSVFIKDTYNSKTINDNSSSDNLLYVENSSIDYLEGDLPRILCVTTTTISKEKLSLINNSKEYTEIKKETKKEIYQWNLEKEYFEISEFDNTKKEL